MSPRRLGRIRVRVRVRVGVGVRVRVGARARVRAMAPHEGVPVGGVGVAVLGHPRGAREQLVEAAHVEQRHRAHDGAEELRPAHEHVAHE